MSGAEPTENLSCSIYALPELDVASAMTVA
jgi:hypothetical protein